MDDTLNLIRQGCRLARELEHNLPSMANQPHLLATSCEQIIQAFSVIQERLGHNPLEAGLGGYRGMLQHRSEVQAGGDGGGNFEELLRSSGYAQAVSILRQTQNWAGTSGERAGDTEQQHQVRLEVEGAVATVRGRFVGTGGGGEEMQAMDVSSDPRRSASSSAGTRRRNSDAEKKTIRVPAPRIGNTEIPPEDGYTWRKYGQKEILGSKFPRGYYRCTHQKLYHCPAKKQVQRLDNDPFIFEVTYRGEHTCHMYSTAPSGPPPPPASLEMAHIATTQPIPASALVPLTRWAPADFSMGSMSASRNMAAGGSGSGGGGSSSGNEAGPSTGGGRRGKEVEYPLVADLADVMFNSGSSSTNSMDLIFPSYMEDKREEEDKKD